MKNQLWRVCLSSPLFIAALVAQSEASAQGIAPYITEMNQITNVNQLRDVSPTDWAYEALRSLTDRYGCIAGFPNQSYRGSQPLSRYEFAAGLNSCLNQIERLIASSETVSQEDLATISRLSQEFEAELTTIGGRVDELETRAAFLEDNQFSTTTKLGGETSFALSQVFGDEKADGSGDLDSVTVFNFRSRLNFNTSFTGKDLLKVRLDALNTIPFGPGEGDDPNVTGTNMTRTAFDEGTDGSVRIGKLYYTFAIGESGKTSKSDHSGHGHDDHGHDDHGHDAAKDADGGHSEHLHGAAEGKLSFVIDAVGGEFNENFANYNEFFSEELTGAVSRFGRFNPIYYQGLEGTGATVNYSFNDTIALSVGYLAFNGSDPLDGAGLFNGSFGAIAQISIDPTDNFGFGLNYVRGHYVADELVVSGETGSETANAPFGEETPTTADHIGLQGKYQISDRISVSAWGGVSFANAQTDGDNEGIAVDAGDDATIFNWAVTLAFPDLLAEGSLGGIIFGQPPRVSSNDSGVEDDDGAFHIEAQYRYQLNDHIALNPGFFAVINPENDSDNDTLYVGTVRTIFEF
ncbi:MAG: iron uptake porin [Cyanobacteria bacterium P01_G01_bin.67]